MPLSFPNSQSQTDPTTGDPNEPLKKTFSDGSKGDNPFYHQSCEILPSSEPQPFIPLAQIYTSGSASVTGNKCQPNPTLEVDYVCPDNFFKKLSDSTPPTNYPATKGRCVPKNNYVLINKPDPSNTDSKACGSTTTLKSGFQYNATTGNCEPITNMPNPSYTCDAKNVAIGTPQPYQLNPISNLCIAKTDNTSRTLDYQCPPGLQADNWNKPCKAIPKASTKAIDDYKHPCVWQKNATTQKKECQPCNLTIKDPKSQNIYCFLDRKNKPICEHRSYKPTKSQCESTLSQHCRWRNNRCVPKPKH